MRRTIDVLPRAVPGDAGVARGRGGRERGREGGREGEREGGRGSFGETLSVISIKASDQPTSSFPSCEEQQTYFPVLSQATRGLLKGKGGRKGGREGGRNAIVRRLDSLAA